MSSNIAGAWAKLERAKQQLQDLGLEVDKLLQIGAYRIVGEHQPDRQRYVFKLLGPPVPDMIAVLTGEIIHHLRCCFDHVAWAIAIKGNAPERRRRQIGFPVCDTAEKFNEAVRRGSLHDPSGIYTPLIEALQPYKISDPDNSILKAIHDLDIADKHRLLVVVSHTLVMGDTLTITRNDAPESSGFGIELPPPTGYPWEIENGVEMHWVPLRNGPNPCFEMETNASIQISFEQVGTVARPPLIVTLTDFYNYTKREIRNLSAALAT